MGSIPGLGASAGSGLYAEVRLIRSVGVKLTKRIGNVSSIEADSTNRKKGALHGVPLVQLYAFMPTNSPPLAARVRTGL